VVCDSDDMYSNDTCIIVNAMSLIYIVELNYQYNGDIENVLLLLRLKVQI
jgi:hypothetical protein